MEKRDGVVRTRREYDYARERDMDRSRDGYAEQTVRRPMPPDMDGGVAEGAAAGRKRQVVPDQWHQGIPSVKNITIGNKELEFQVRESINVLRGNVQLSGYNLKVIALTSSLANEGKSSISFELAKSMAGLNKKVIYLDCDIRNSVIRSRYNISEKGIGLTEYLCGEGSIRDIVYKTENPWLDIIFTGKVAPNPSELISGALFTQLLSQLRDYYDYVIVDTPPINAVVDGLLVAKQCDGTMLVVESGVTDRSQAIHAKRQLEFAGVKVIGVVLNKVGTRKSGYGYGKYGYGYGYGKYGYGYGAGNTKDKKKADKEEKK
ncbi:MAG: CpsD/CapB family tyrosine-protein kinase [Blautia sp.]|nr:CpsD/CapB family tyrosine-protein kinase [Blautia sp.]